jgi:type IV pilus assembly protein PilY1
MNIPSNWLLRTLLAACFLSPLAQAEDIDIFTGTTEVDTSLPNVIFVLDNTSNWSRTSQRWPGGVDQGQSEVRAIKLALANKVGKLNVGIMEYVTGGSSADTDAAYTRFNLQKLDSAALTALNTTLDTIFNNINDPSEKRSSSNPYGYLPWDLYNYLGGFEHSKDGAGNTGGLADAAAYDTVHSNFRSPLDAANTCGDTYMIFIGNNANGAVKGDDGTNTAALKALYQELGLPMPNALAGDSSGTPLGMPEFSCTQVTTPGELISAEVPEIRENQSVTRTIAAEVGKTLGTSALCYRSTQVANCTTAERGRAGGPCNVSPGLPAPAPTAGTCSCTVAVASPAGATPACVTTGNPSLRTSRYRVVGNIASYPVTTIESVVIQAYQAAVYGDPVVTDVCSATNTVNTTDGKPYNFDDWALFLKKQGVPVTVDDEEGNPVDKRVKVTTYVIDVFNAQQSSTLSSVWFSAANAGGGRYFQAKNEQQLIDAINAVAEDIIAESSSFAAVSLPLSATNRAQVDNQVYIGMFRPSLGKKPRWFGNLKRYQLALFNDIPGLADTSLELAANTNNGNLRSCAKSFWTEDSDEYWKTLEIDPEVKSACSEAGVEPWSDLPDGDFVEKGGVAQQTRQLENGAARVLYTASDDTTLRALAASDATAMGGTSVYNYVIGDVAGAGEVMPADGLRASVHGDVVHSRPLAIRYSASVVSLFYGANDGFFRAVNPANGSERWALLAPEHFSKVQRLYDNSPAIKYTGAELPGEELKDYFFDGSTGELLLYDNNNEIDQAYIYLSQRRGGRRIYALDVTDPTGAPDLLGAPLDLRISARPGPRRLEVSSRAMWTVATIPNRSSHLAAASITV